MTLTEGGAGAALARLAEGVALVAQGGRAGLVDVFVALARGRA